MAPMWRPAQGTGIRSLGPGIEFNIVSAIFEYLPHGLAFIDANLVIRAANKAFAEQMQHPLVEIVGCPAGEVIPGFTERVQPLYCQVQETGWPIHAGAYPYQCPEQPERGVTYWDYTVLPVHEPDGALDGYLMAHREVTERVHTELECAWLRAEA